jgi:hypothetical protein
MSNITICKTASLGPSTTVPVHYIQPYFVVGVPSVRLMRVAELVGMYSGAAPMFKKRLICEAISACLT